MKFLEFGNSENKKIMLIHGFQVPWQVWKPQIDFFSQKYYVIVPILDGHNPIEKVRLHLYKKRQRKLKTIISNNMAIKYLQSVACQWVAR